MTSSLRTDAGPPSWVKNKVTIVVVGDPKVGKTSLITSLVSDIFQENVAPKVAPVVITPASTPEHVEIQILDTSSAVEDEAQLDSDMKKADVICVVYAVNDPATKESIRTRWLPKIRHLGLTVPVVLVGNKFDLAASERTLEDLRRELEPIMNQYREVETCIECSAKTSLNVDEVFFFAQKAVIYPTAVLYDLAEGQFKPKCVAAFKRIFKLCDIDKDGVLDDHELNEFQKTCFEAPLSVDDLKKLKATIRRQQPDGITDRGLTLAGFLWLQHYFMKKCAFFSHHRSAFVVTTQY
jgi:Ras family protein T1